MSLEITTAFVQEFSANIDLLSQQMMSRFMDRVRMESQSSETQFFEQIGATDAVEATSRHDDTPRVDTPHARRAVSLSTFRWADLIDQADKTKLLSNPTTEYAQSAVMALNRKRDDIVIEAALGVSRTGKNGTTNVPLPAEQKIVVGGVGLNLNKLLEASRRLNEEEVDPDMRRYMAITSRQLQDLLEEPELTSADFAVVKTLVEGKIDTFMGFTFIRTERLTLDTNGDRQVIAWAEDGLLMSSGSNDITRITEREDKNYSVQVFRQEQFGATRMEEVKVVEIACLEP
ncbi:MAG: phage capsid protein [Thiotrichaceae bacterium]